MSTYIKPTLTVVSNANSAANDKGPLSIALALTAKPLNNRIGIAHVKSGIITPTTAATELFQDITLAGDAAGTNGAFIYLKNTSAADHDIYIGAKASGSEGAGATELEGDGDPDRLGTLKQGEFLFMPYDYAMDITVDAEDNAATLEWWLFSRTTP
mgnify:CR=1 FL=1|tara:strand:- start:3428 stop:3895 length:468 start_codon:yes stop_codon:yes gene_type:complete